VRPHFLYGLFIVQHNYSTHSGNTAGSLPLNILVRLHHTTGHWAARGCAGLAPLMVAFTFAGRVHQGTDSYKLRSLVDRWIDLAIELSDLQLEEAKQVAAKRRTRA
jgi:hypothetical protein